MTRPVQNISQLWLGMVFGSILGILSIVVSGADRVSVQPEKVVKGIFEESKGGRQKFPVLVNANGTRFSCQMRVCSLGGRRFPLGAEAIGQVNADGMLISLQVNGEKVLAVDMFSASSRWDYWSIAALAVLLILSLKKLFYKEV